MKETKIVEEVIKKKVVVDKVICDICEQKIERENGFDNSEVTIGAKIGSYYPEGDFRTGYVIDCCPKCFITKIKPLIEEEFNTEFREFDVEDEKIDNY